MNDKENSKKLVERALGDLQKELAMYAMRPSNLYDTSPRWKKMLDGLLLAVGMKVSEIPLNRPDVFELMSGVAEFEGHPYLPDRSIFFLGSVWELPGIGQKCCARALKESGAVHSFFELVQVTKKALSYTRKEKVPLDDACRNALKGYVFTYLFLRYPTEWNRQYCKFMHPVCMRGDEEEDKLSSKEKHNRQYWEDVLMLPSDGDHDIYHDIFSGELFPKILRKRLYEGYPASLPGTFENETEEAISSIKKVMVEEGLLEALVFAEEELKGTCSDFWIWLTVDRAKEYQEDPELERIACYCPNAVTYRQKLELLQIADECLCAEGTFQPKFYTEKPTQSYDERRRMVLLQLVKNQNARFQALKAYSDSFTKFSTDTESGRLFEECTDKEIRMCLWNISDQDLLNAFVLYYPAQRAYILENRYSFRFQMIEMEDFKNLSQEFSLAECVQSEEKIANILKRYKNSPKNMEENNLSFKFL